jgi:hypothetical protein
VPGHDLFGGVDPLVELRPRPLQPVKVFTQLPLLLGRRVPCLLRFLHAQAPKGQPGHVTFAARGVQQLAAELPRLASFASQAREAATEPASPRLLPTSPRCWAATAPLLACEHLAHDGKCSRIVPGRFDLKKDS